MFMVDKEKKQEVEKIEEEEKTTRSRKNKAIRAMFINNTLVGKKLFNAWSHRITEEQKNIIEDSIFFKKWKILIFNP